MTAGLSGCGGGDTVQEALGYQPTGPDEMAVIKRPPLIVPPDYNLRPPRADDQNAAGSAASDAARKTLIGPSSSLEGSSTPGEGEGEGEGDGAKSADARAILTGSAGENGSAKASETASDGENLLISRTDRAERNLDELNETRGENRVDSALLRRLLAWSPEDRPAAVADGDEAGIAEETAVVQLVARFQTPIDDLPNTAQESSE